MLEDWDVTNTMSLEIKFDTESWYGLAGNGLLPPTWNGS